jgi:hypothetical protein
MRVTQQTLLAAPTAVSISGVPTDIILSTASSPGPNTLYANTSFNVVAPVRNVPANPLLGGTQTWIAMLTHAGTTPFKVGSRVTVGGVTPSTYNATVTVVGAGLIRDTLSGCFVELQYTTATPGVYTSGGTITQALETLPVPLDFNISPFSVGLQVATTGTVNYTVQYTFADPFAQGFDPATATWTNHASLSALAATADSNIAFGCRAVRCIINSGTGSVVFTVVQAAGNNG